LVVDASQGLVSGDGMLAAAEEEELDASACEAAIMVAEHGLAPEQFELRGGAGSSPSPAGTAASHTAASLQLSPSDSTTVRLIRRPFWLRFTYVTSVLVTKY
jgi:hypothetical protein